MIFISLPFFILSCANLAEDRWDEQDKEEELRGSTTKAKTSVKTPSSSADLLPAEETGDNLQLVDPDTTSELLKDENKKTVSGPIPAEVTAPGSDSAIDIKPSRPAPAEE
ncbi:hypothetical protein N9005_03560 [Akkermansiaceae bacterium]|nr:hypothetical protein [Akkermansiaceae bacterium]